MKILAHKDLDGAVSAIVAKRINHHADIIFCDYDDVNDLVRKHIENHFLLLLDISISKDTADWIVSSITPKGVHGYPITIFDHHKTAEWLKDSGLNFIYDNDMCGARLYYDYMRKQSPYLPIQEYSLLVLLANDYDMWLHEFPRSKELNILLYELGFDRFVNRFLEQGENVCMFTDAEELIIELAQERKENYIKQQLQKLHQYKTHKNDTIFVLLDDRYCGEIAERIRSIEEYNDVSYIMFVNIQNGKVSLRQCHSSIDLGEVAKDMNNGGGHKNAAGFSWTFDIDQIVQELLP